MEGKKFTTTWTIFRILAWIQVNRQARENALRCILPTRRSQVTQSLAWHPPPESWVQLHTDVSMNGLSGRAVAGGLLRDHLGRCVDAFTCNLGKCTITIAEP
ncbi:unnamed protein product [Linum trigynum]|uniref:RNase H type-1 domain-containing protein n=1 Tax=Linum trigynum TaxID=586398 RepID=A0AAV2DFM9_9ROSI